MRDKEVVQDYRYLPEPNLVPLHLDMTNSNGNSDLVNVTAINKLIPILPDALRNKLISKYNMTPNTAIILVNEQALFKIFQSIIEEKPKRSVKLITNILINELLTVCNKNNIDLQVCPIKHEYLGELIDMLESQEINLNLAKLILQEMLENSLSPREIAVKNEWRQISDENTIRKICDEVLRTKEGQDMARQYRSGKTKILFAIAGEINSKTKNRINMAKVMDLLKEKLV
jgi:aspartyl-tRNA(Asn)/glutamyl-tRNA(Gln) amidotransferase subunit B